MQSNNLIEEEEEFYIRKYNSMFVAGYEMHILEEQLSLILWELSKTHVYVYEIVIMFMFMRLVYMKSTFMFKALTYCAHSFVLIGGILQHHKETACRTSDLFSPKP